MADTGSAFVYQVVLERSWPRLKFPLENEAVAFLLRTCLIIIYSNFKT